MRRFLTFFGKFLSLNQKIPAFYVHQNNAPKYKERPFITATTTPTREGGNTDREQGPRRLGRQRSTTISGVVSSAGQGSSRRILVPSLFFHPVPPSLVGVVWCRCCCCCCCCCTKKLAASSFTSLTPTAGCPRHCF